VARRILFAAGLVLVAALTAVAVVLLTDGRSGSGEAAERTEIDPVAATGAFTPRVALFGDTLTARVDVVVDREFVDPEGVTVSWAPQPWALVARPVRSRRDSEGTTHLRTTYVLRCLTRPCVPVRETEELDFAPARVSYPAAVGDGTRTLSVDVTWPTLVVHSRVGQADDRRDVLAAPWRAELLSLPPVSYAVSPVAVLVLLLLGGTVLFALAGVLVYRAIPEREPPPEPEPEPVPVATLLEQALAYLEAPAAANGAPERRRALELVADEVEGWGEPDLARTARALAWSEHEPESELTKAFAAQLRSRMESLNGNAA
jgi:hypothetical protein